jgi:O-antigen/teichoic acid export membrane protein
VFGSAAIGRLNVELSSWTLVAVVAATVPSVLVAKYVAEHLARGHRTRAARVLGASLAITWVLMGGAVVARSIASGRGLIDPWPYYGFGYATYLVVRSAYFAHQRARAVLFSEIVAFAVFGTILCVALVTRDERLAPFALAAQPLVYAAKAIWELRSDIGVRGALQEVRRDARGYAVFSGASFANAGTGLASYHLAVVLAGHLTTSADDVGYLSVLLSALSPINLVPQALGAILFAEFARRHGIEDLQGQRAVALKATVLLQLFVLLFVGSLLAFPAAVVRAIHLPSTPEVIHTWQWLAYTLGLTIASSPCGHLLSATRHAAKQAIASLVFLAVGLAVGCSGMPRYGILAAGWMRFGVDGGLAWTRMILANALTRWTANRKFELLGFQLCFGAVFGSSLLSAPGIVSIVPIIVGVAGLVFAARRDLRSLSPRSLGLSVS